MRFSVSFSNDQLLVVNYRFRRVERRARCSCAGASLRQAAGRLWSRLFLIPFDFARAQRSSFHISRSRRHSSLLHFPLSRAQWKARSAMNNCIFYRRASPPRHYAQFTRCYRCLHPSAFDPTAYNFHPNLYASPYFYNQWPMVAC